MTDRERRVYNELERLDLHLAGLFREALQYVERAHEPGAVYMLSHAGRELSNAILRLLSGEGDPLTDEEAARVPKGEDNRVKIARALELPVQHPSVTTWMRAHNALQETAHFRSKAPSSDRVQQTIEAFRTLVDILVGRIGLYFDARLEINALLEIADPSAADVERLRALALRPQLRRTFFNQLQHPGWLEPLRAVGLFREAPDFAADPETGDPTAPAWPEGEYLIRIAPDAPGPVTDVLLEIPDRIRNPIVWRSATDAALRLPPAEAARLVRMLSAALDQTSHPMVARGVFAVAEHLAAGGEASAMDLLRPLVHVAPAPDGSTLSTSTTGEVAVLPNMRHTARPRDFLALVEGVAVLRGRAAVARLCSALDRMLAIEYGSPEGREPPVPDYSRFRGALLEEDEDRSPKSLIAAAIMRAAQAAISREDTGRDWVLERFFRYPWHVFLRLRLAFLAGAPVFDQAALDAAVGDLVRLDERPVLPEYRKLIRAHFQYASPEIRQAVIAHILEGPDEETVRRRVEAGPEDDGDQAAQQFRRHWQRHLVRLFGDAPPPELVPLAKELDTIGEVLSKHERDMDEKGFSVDAGVTAGPPSPLSLEAVREMGVEELIEYLRRFEPQRGWNVPTPAALATVLAERVQEDPAWASMILPRVVAVDVDPTYIRGLLEGLVRAVKAGRQIPWSESLALVEYVATRPPEAPTEGSLADHFDYRDPGLTWARRIAADFISDAVSGNLLPPEHLEDLWSAVAGLVRAEATWQGAPADAHSMDDVLHLELNHLGGKAAEALFDVALFDYRAWEREGAGGEWGGRERLRPLLNTIIDQVGEPAVAARSSVGRYLAHLLLLDRPWLEEHWDRVFKRAVEAPFLNPVFASYVVNGRLYQQSFALLRPLYEEAVLETGREANDWTAGSESFRPGRRLIDHLVGAFRVGWLALDADAELLDRAFSGALAEDTAHVWWTYFRLWTDSQNPIDRQDVSRILEIWGWRLTRLEEEVEGERRRREAEGFGWLAMTEAIPDGNVLPLLLRSIRLSAGGVPIAGALWERLARLAGVDTRATMEVARLIISAELEGEFPHFNFEELAPVLRAGLRSGDAEAEELAERTVHLLGERGFEQFGELLRDKE